MDIMEKTESYEFIFFLTFLVEKKEFTATDIIDVVEKPFKYQLKWEEFLNDRRN